MKKLLLFLFPVFGFAAFAQAQNQKMYTVARTGGAYGDGTIVSMNDNASGFNVEYNFNWTYGATPSGNLLAASDGNLYGTCVDGGAYASCVIFRYNPDSGSYRDVYDFMGTEGDFPCSGLIEGSDGKLYGMTPMGGTSSNGVIYSFDMSTLMYTKLFDFGGNFGTGPQGQLLQVGGWLYGMAEMGGNYNCGTLFAYQPANNYFVVLHHFSGSTDGRYPYGSVMVGADGKLYGMTSAGGGAGSMGSIFSYDLLTSTFTTVHSLGLTDGSTPYGTLLQGSDGKIYGATSAGGNNNYGTLFSIDPSNNNAFTVEHNFTTTTGNYPQGELSEDNSGRIWGTTMAGGVNGFGNIFCLNPSTHVCFNMHSFTSAEGQQPNGALLFHGGPLGITEQADAAGALSVYPNPASDVLHVSFHNSGNTEAAFTIYDVTGKEISSWKEEDLPMDYIKPVDVSSLNDGIYFLQVQSGGSVTRQRFVVK